VLDDRLTERHLTVAGQHRAAPVTDRQYCGAVKHRILTLSA
jgi:hypothetical protein